VPKACWSCHLQVTLEGGRQATLLQSQLQLRSSRAKDEVHPACHAQGLSKGRAAMYLHRCLHARKWKLFLRGPSGHICTSKARETIDTSSFSRRNHLTILLQSCFHIPRSVVRRPQIYTSLLEIRFANITIEHLGIWNLKRTNKLKRAWLLFGSGHK